MEYIVCVIVASAMLGITYAIGFNNGAKRTLQFIKMMTQHDDQ